MRTVTVRLPDELADAIEEESRATRRSKSDVIRERLQSAGTSAPQAVDPGLHPRPHRVGGWVAAGPREPYKYYLRARVMAANVIADSSFLVTLLGQRERQLAVG